MRFGMDYGGTNLKTGLFNEDGSVISFTEKKLADLIAPGNLLQNLINHSKNIIGNNKIECGGLAIKGLVNTSAGVVESDIGAGDILAGINLKEIFSNELGFPFFIENDARAYAWGEYKFGAGVGCNALACVTLGTGLGCALVINGKTYYGSDSSGGLLGGHISIDRNGPECTCGNIGCLELFCSATALSKKVKTQIPELKNEIEPLPQFFDFVKEGRSVPCAVFNEFIDNLSIGIVNIIHAYGPDVVVIGGGVLNSADIILPRLIPLVNKRAWTYPKNKVKLRCSKLGNNAAAIGVAFLEM